MFRFRGMTAAAVISAMAVFLGTGVAQAAPGYTTGSVNLRTGPSTAYPRVATIPRGAAIEIFDCQSWCSVSWRGLSGWVSGSYVRFGGYTPPAYVPPVYAPPVIPPPVNLAPFPYFFGFGFQNAPQQPGYWYYPNP